MVLVANAIMLLPCFSLSPLMLAAMHGKISCVQKLLEVGANLLMFDSLNGRTCLHYVAYYGHSDCLQALLSSSHSSPVAISWLEKKVSPDAARGRRRTSSRHHCLSPRL
ncbi:putative E3 ubiquitin-protein ligase XBAT31 isoform X2 [Cannabis sativa]|uniref:putative E3 ubiquitin-protein ligase XBAT31 isoform X2 n=1 Tax=Cannabis sativa TaxID=3483 RepID=UPI0029CA3FED|nr:putative E3 ubiquitin-protein ligase XBAT31 isoform X2 [Cannabis sativa]